jgi:hypothetical protein
VDRLTNVQQTTVSMDGLTGTIWKKLHDICNSDLLAERFPRFAARFGSLHDALVKTFSCGLDTATASHADISVYGLGLLCLEDFAEIVFLATHDYGYAAVKLLRGLYERAVVNATIVENPSDEAAKFFNYYTVDERKFNRRAADVYEDWNIDPSRMQQAYESMKDVLKYEPCAVCHQRPQTSWTRYALDALAGNLGKATNDASLKELGNELKEFYLHCAAIPNMYIHASMFSILQRLTETSEGFVFDPATYAVSNAHVLILMALTTQNQYFALGMDTTLDRLHEDRAAAWPNDRQNR